MQYWKGGNSGERELFNMIYSILTMMFSMMYSGLLCSEEAHYNKEIIRNNIKKL